MKVFTQPVAKKENIADLSLDLWTHYRGFYQGHFETVREVPLSQDKQDLGRMMLETHGKNY